MGLEQYLSHPTTKIVNYSHFPTHFLKSFILLQWPFPNPHPEAWKIVAVREATATTWDTHYDKST
jgi:hypothetical protein